jgi:hypothetical protein
MEVRGSNKSSLRKFFRPVALRAVATSVCIRPTLSSFIRGSGRRAFGSPELSVAIVATINSTGTPYCFAAAAQSAP